MTIRVKNGLMGRRERPLRTYYWGILGSLDKDMGVSSALTGNVEAIKSSLGEDKTYRPVAVDSVFQGIVKAMLTLTCLLKMRSHL